MAAARPLLGLAAAAAEAAVLLLLLIGAIAVPAAECQVLVMGAYNETCPQAEDVVLKEMTAMVAKSPDLAAAVLRLFSLDCFVGGCEGSILLDSTPGNTAEKDAPLNRGVRGYEVVDAIKAKLDAACPGVVSCADTLALAARDSIRLTKGPFIPLPTGRRDGNRSVAADVALFSPAPDANITDIINLFAIRFNLTAKDVAVLSGAVLDGVAAAVRLGRRQGRVGPGAGRQLHGDPARAVQARPATTPRSSTWTPPPRPPSTPTTTRSSPATGASCPPTPRCSGTLPPATTSSVRPKPPRRTSSSPTSPRPSSP
ncbi:hypothetical protein BDA96_02G004000 [Sorghum bicolor]|uniref:Peroxidase n=1 Tax=Sorghum bicolor TaxID=4558 RepID=A0A921RLZ7_SORBI|nr:hypothetical protein BDA96_02G004000 [Sorghum bicolor]